MFRRNHGQLSTLNSPLEDNLINCIIANQISRYRKLITSTTTRLLIQSNTVDDNKASSKAEWYYRKMEDRKWCHQWHRPTPIELSSSPRISGRGELEDREGWRLELFQEAVVITLRSPIRPYLAVKNHIHIYTVANTVRALLRQASIPLPWLNAAKISYYTVKIRRKLESRGFSRESGVNYRFDTSSWTSLLDRLSIKGFYPMHLVASSAASLSRAFTVSIREESGYLRGIASNADN